MKMRWKPLRGEKYTLDNGDQVTILDILESGAYVNVILNDGKMRAIPLRELPLPVIDTKNYSKIYD